MNNNDIAIKVNNLSKRYRIGVKEEMAENLVGAFFNQIMSPIKNYRRYLSLYKFNEDALEYTNENNSDIIWAVKDISFEVKRGEVVGIIGNNGAGKSTLLKIFSRITEPTSGSIEIYGKVASLLEVGTGFHPELTGRENIYLNSTVLGMKKREVDQAFDDIVAFSGVEKFLDTPVKRYSSGMKVRLAFSVAAHLNPEILIIDEVLAVGDASFQKKCLGKMKDVTKEGRTVLFVSHNMQSVIRLCDRVIQFDNGKILEDGSPHQVVSTYLNSGTRLTAECVWSDKDNAPGNDFIRLAAVRVKKEKGGVTDKVDIRESIGIEMEFNVFKSDKILLPVYNFYNEEGVVAFSTFDQNPEWLLHPRPIGYYVSTVWVPGNFLAEGMMIVGVAFVTVKPRKVIFNERDLISFQVIRLASSTPTYIRTILSC